MNKEPTISVIMPCYNESTRIAESIRSVFNQTFPSLELIVVDDGSKDDSLEVLDRLSREYDSLRFISQPNKGAGPARNRGLNVARGQYIAFLDADDSWHPECLTSLHAGLESFPDAILAYCGWQNKGLSENRCKPFIPPDYENADKIETLLRGCRWPIHAAITRRTAIDTAGGFNENLTASEDYDLWLRIATANKIVRVPGVLAYYHHHTGEQVTKNRLRIAQNNFRIQRLFLNEHPEIRKSLGRRKTREIIEGEILQQGYQCFWQRDLNSSHSLFREALSHLYFSPKDIKYLLPALLPYQIYKALILKRDN